MHSSPHPTRRHVLLALSATALAFSGLRALAAVPAAPHTAGYGPLAPATGYDKPLLALPEGFTYQVLSVTGHVMRDGLKVPGRPDGMAAFPGADGRTLLVRNHELQSTNHWLYPSRGRTAFVSTVPPETLAKLYDRGNGVNIIPGGGTTTLVLDTSNPARIRVEDEYLSLGGTLMNCAGGPTPWGTWLSCEETLIENHGYVFEVDPRSGGLAKARPLKMLGRFMHEAVAVHPNTRVLYMTEDPGTAVSDSLFYRFVMNTPGNIAAGGRLQALVLADNPGADTSRWDHATMPQAMTVKWIDLEDIDNPARDLHRRGHRAGAAYFARGEGIWADPATADIYFSATSGGPDRYGQIWRYRPSPAEGTSDEASAPGQLALFIASSDRAILNRPDNLTVAPWGHLIVCEDNGSSHQFIRGITPEGHIYPVAQKLFRSANEFAGVCFSPDGRILFVNIQEPGITLAITGPWDKLKG
jgi:secreted PhoX family phosphatase